MIAVKRLKQILGEQDKQFKNEFNHLAKLNHDNIVKLIGYCDDTKVRPVYDDYQQKYVIAEEQEKLLCYEYLSNGSLDNIIFSKMALYTSTCECVFYTSFFGTKLMFYIYFLCRGLTWT